MPSIALFDTYLYAKHAPSRNAYIKSITEAKEGEPDFDSGSGMSDIEAAQIIGAIDGLGAIATRVHNAEASFRKIGKDINKTRLDAGLVTQE